MNEKYIVAIVMAAIIAIQPTIIFASNDTKQEEQKTVKITSFKIKDDDNGNDKTIEDKEVINPPTTDDKAADSDDDNSKYYKTHDDKQVDYDKNPDDAFCNSEKGRDGLPFCDIANVRGSCYDRNDDEVGYCKQYAKDDPDFCELVRQHYEGLK